MNLISAAWIALSQLSDSSLVSDMDRHWLFLNARHTFSPTVQFIELLGESPYHSSVLLTRLLTGALSGRAVSVFERISNARRLLVVVHPIHTPNSHYRKLLFLHACSFAAVSVSVCMLQLTLLQLRNNAFPTYG